MKRFRGVPEPYAEPPHAPTPAGLIAWLVGRQWTAVLQGTVCDIVWLLGLALTPWAIGQAIDQGLVAGDASAFLVWLLVVVWLQLQHSLIQGLRDRAGSINFERAASRIDQVIARTSARVTVAADRTLHPGAVVTMASDSWALCFLPINVGSLVSALVAFVTVAVLLLRESVLLGVLVLVGVPVFSAVSFALVKSLHVRQSDAWAARSAMNVVATDSVKGLRVLRGIGGERRFLARYAEHSARVRETGVRVTWPMAAATALGVVIAGTFVGALTWVGGILVVNGDLQVGALVAFYGYAGFLLLPVSLVNQVMTVGVAAAVSAKQICGLLRVEPDWTRAAAPPADDAGASSGASGSAGVALSSAPGGARLDDEATGLHAEAGELLGVVVSDAGTAGRLVDRLGRLAPDTVDGAVRLDGVAYADLPIEQVRRRVVVSDPVPFLFSGTLRELLDPWQRHDDAGILRALDAAAAGDIVESVDEGLDVQVGERGIEFSGGQRQRLGAARALLADAQLLVLHDPTSSVDASTEERMAAGLRAHRRGRTTIVITTSPLVLAVADRVALVVDGAVAATGRHHELLESVDDYRATVLRAEGVR